MTEGSIFKNLLFFAAPLILGNLLQQMYNAVDSIIVGNYVGSNALAAVGAGASLIYLLIAFSREHLWVQASLFPSIWEQKTRKVFIRRYIQRWPFPSFWDWC